MTIAEVKRLKPNMPIVDLRARFVRAFERKDGEGEYGPWSLQTFEVEDDTGTIYVLAKDRPEDFRELGWNDKEIVISSVEGKNGWTGAVALDDEFSGEVRRKVKLTKSGICKLAPQEEERLDRPPERAPKPALSDLIALVEAIYPRLKRIEEDGQARAAILNTILIALTTGRVCHDEKSRKTAGRTERQGEKLKRAADSLMACASPEDLVETWNVLTKFSDFTQDEIEELSHIREMRKKALATVENLKREAPR